jgi:arsenate reductase
MAIIYHNPRCSKSRSAVALCEASTRTVAVRLYLSTPLSKEELFDVLSRLDQPISTSIRMKDPKFKLVDSTNLNPDSLNSVVEFLSSHGHLMERPLYDNGVTSIIGRPVELLLPHL